MLLIHAIILKLIFASIHMVLLHFARGILITAFSFQLFLVCFAAIGMDRDARNNAKTSCATWKSWCGRVFCTVSYCESQSYCSHFASTFFLLINYHFSFMELDVFPSVKGVVSRFMMMLSLKFLHIHSTIENWFSLSLCIDLTVFLSFFFVTSIFGPTLSQHSWHSHQINHSVDSIHLNWSSFVERIVH